MNAANIKTTPSVQGKQLYILLGLLCASLACIPWPNSTDESDQRADIRCTDQITADFSDAGLTDLLVLEDMPGLIYCDLSRNPLLSDISLLSRFTRLQYLNLGECGSLIDIAPLGALHSIDHLDLRNCRLVTDLSPISSLTELKALNISECDRVEDFSPVSVLPNLISLHLNGCDGLKSIPALASKGIRFLDAGNCDSLSDISSLSFCTNLRALDVRTCMSLNDISPIFGCKNLQELLLNGSRICSLYLADMPHLRTITLPETVTFLHVSNTPLSESIAIRNGTVSKDRTISQVSFHAVSALRSLSIRFDMKQQARLVLRNLPNLERITLHTASMKELTIEDCPRLEYFYFMYANLFTDLSALASCNQLRTLRLDIASNLEDISHVSKFPLCTELHLSYCGALTDISPIGTCKNLKHLVLEKCNKITSLEPLRHMSQITYLEITRCSGIKDYEPLRSILDAGDILRINVSVLPETLKTALEDKGVKVN